MNSRIFQNIYILQILDYYQSIWALDHLTKLAAWDSEVYMPVKGARFRGKSLAKTQTLVQSLILDKNFVNLINSCSNEELNDYEKAVIRVLKRELKLFQSLPPQFIEEFEEEISQAQVVWRKARNDNDFKLFAPHLAKIVELSRKKSTYLGFKNHSYDALLDVFEEGNTTAFLDTYFQEVISVVTNLLKHIKSSNKFLSESPVEKLTYNQNDAVNLNKLLLEFLKYDPGKLRLDISSHPFSEGLSTDDSRITTRYERQDIVKTITSTIHEFGHALYFLQHDEQLNCTPLYTNYSLALHESQSRFFENHIGRSREFLNQNLSAFKELGQNYAEYGVDDYYYYFNRVKPGLIRVEADEVTYHAHIYIRYEIEKHLIEGEIEALDVPKVWSDMYQQYLGLTPPNDREGCLQDIHWSMGAIGYFPTYSMGTIFAAQIASKLASENGSISETLRTNDGILTIENWLKERIHKYGATYTLDQLAHKLTDTSLDIKHWENYLVGKYKSLY